MTRRLKYPYNVKEIKRFYEAGLNLKQIARNNDYPYLAMYRYLRRNHPEMFKRG